MDHLTPDLGLFYGLAAEWQEDATLAGSETILAQEGELAEEGTETTGPPEAESEDKRPLLVVVDSGGRVRQWHGLRVAGFWRDVVALCSHTTPTNHLEFLRRHRVDYFIEGNDRIDLQKALAALKARYGIEKVRVDAGGKLNGALLRAGLVDELSLLVAPTLVGGESPRSLFRAPDLTTPAGVIPASLASVEQMGEGYVWIRYIINKE